MLDLAQFWTRKTIALILIFAGMLFLRAAQEPEGEQPSVSSIVVKRILFFLAFLNLTIGIGWSYQIAANPKQLKLLDWCLVGFILSMMPIFEILGLMPWWWIVLIVIPCILGRCFISYWIRR